MFHLKVLRQVESSLVPVPDALMDHDWGYLDVLALRRAGFHGIFELNELFQCGTVFDLAFSTSFNQLCLQFSIRLGLGGKPNDSAGYVNG